MFEYSKVLEFCNGVGISVESFFLIHTIFLRNSEEDVDLFREMNVYYSTIPQNEEVDYVSIAISLQKKGLIKSSRRYVKGDKQIELKHFSLTDKCRDLLLCNPEEVWDKFVKLYPKTGRFSDGTEFDARVIKRGDKEYFIKHILKNSSRPAAARVLYIVEDLYDGGNLPAEMALSNFLTTWNIIQEEYENGTRTRKDVSYSGYKR